MKRTLGNIECTAIGLGCMNLSHGYGQPTDRKQAERILTEALAIGYSHLDTATLYGNGANETLIGEVLSHRRNEFTLASKCGLGVNEQGVREVNGRPEVLKAQCEASLKKLKTDVIDLYYLHRWDQRVPIEESVGALGDLVKEGKIRQVGLSEVSATTLDKAHKEHPIAAVQTEYSLWTRNPEIAVLEKCKALGTTFVSFSPLGRGFLSATLPAIDKLDSSDMRQGMPRFQGAAYQHNLALLNPVKEVAKAHNVTAAQIALAWVLAKAPHIVAIPGTTSYEHLKDNFEAQSIVLHAEEIALLDDVFEPNKILGHRYPPAMQVDVDTEEFA
jgi:aryl-alcohol dehydrogenase-like predicted oxidoreductase